LVESVKNKEVDVAINWKASAYSKENRNKIDILYFQKLLQNRIIYLWVAYHLVKILN